MDPDNLNHPQEDDLEGLLIQLRHWWALHGTKVLVAVTVVALAFTAKRVIDARAIAAKQQAWYDLANATSPDSYLNVAQTHPNQTVQALANLRAADLLLFSVVKPTDTAETQPDPESKQQNLDEATIRYTHLIDDPNQPVLFRINAHLGLATVAESRGDWNQATAEYNNAIELAGPGYDALNRYAKTRLDLIPRLKIPVVFAPDPVADAPTETDTSTEPPQTDPATPTDLP